MRDIHAFHTNPQIIIERELLKKEKEKKTKTRQIEKIQVSWLPDPDHER